MADIIRLAPHDPLPEGFSVVVLNRFDEEEPDRTITEIILHGRTGIEATRPVQDNGAPMSFDDAVANAVRVADSEGIAAVHAIDRTQGEREQDILRHGGDHSVHMEQLSDTDLEDGERGADMRDVMHPVSPS